MIVRVTTTQLNALRRLNVPAANRWLTAPEAAPGTITSWDVVMPAVGWKVLHELLQQRILGPKGGIRAGAQRAAVNASRRIARARALMEAHPALRGVAIPELSALTIPVWCSTKGGPLSIYPVPGQPMWILWPQREEWGGMMVTRWDLTIPVPADGALSDERVHLAFVSTEQPGQVVR
jgi:hypothetical protein